ASYLCLDRTRRSSRAMTASDSSSQVRPGDRTTTTLTIPVGAGSEVDFEGTLHLGSNTLTLSGGGQGRLHGTLQGGTLASANGARSEERRVGEERRTRRGRLSREGGNDAGRIA